MTAKDTPQGATSILLNAEGLPKDRKYSLWKDAVARLMANKLAVVSLALVIFLIIIALIGPYITPYDFLSQDLDARSQVPHGSTGWALITWAEMCSVA